MTSFVGTIQTANGEPLGIIRVSLSDAGKVSGNMRVGALPAQGLTGFSGEHAGGQFVATGENRLQHDPADPYDDVLLAVALEGKAAGPDMVGIIQATFNGAPFTWPFQAVDMSTKDGARMMAAHQSRGLVGGVVETVTDAGGAVVSTGKTAADLAMMAWEKLPTFGKAAAAAGAGYVVYRKFIK